jgi:uncharacterized protein
MKMLAEPISFIADVHLGKLARMLRMLGIDTKYRNDFTNNQLVEIAEAEGRILLTRSNAFARNAVVPFFRIESEEPQQQLQQVFQGFDLQENVHPFSLCLVCNGVLEPRQKDEINAVLEENTRQFFHHFWQCSSCRRIYWKGSHYEKMQKVLKMLEHDLKTKG